MCGPVRAKRSQYKPYVRGYTSVDTATLNECKEVFVRLNTHRSGQHDTPRPMQPPNLLRGGAGFRCSSLRFSQGLELEIRCWHKVIEVFRA